MKRMRTSPLPATCAMALLAVLGALPPSVAAQVVGEAGAGATLFETRCAACHSLDTSRVGPMLRGVVGRKVASVAGYAYSDALRRVNGRWDARRLEMWLRDPQAVAPGTAMAFSLSSAADRQAVIHYLSSMPSPVDAVKR